MAGELTKKFEGWREYIYDDKTGKPAIGKPKGKRTIGYGFNIDDPIIAKFLPKDVLSGKRTLTKEEAEQCHTDWDVGRAFIIAEALVGKVVKNE